MMSAKVVEGSTKDSATEKGKVCEEDFFSDTDDEESFDDFGQEPVDDSVGRIPSEQREIKTTKSQPQDSQQYMTSSSYDKFSAGLNTSGYKTYSNRSSLQPTGRYSSSYGDYDGLGHDSYTGLYGSGPRSLTARVADGMSSGYYYGYGSHGSDALLSSRAESYSIIPRLSSRSRQVMREGYDISLSAGIGSSGHRAGTAGLKAMYDVRKRQILCNYNFDDTARVVIASIKIHRSKYILLAKPVIGHE